MARLKESVARVEQERDALQKSLIEVRAELAQSNEARAEMAGQLAVLRPMQGSTTGVAAPTTAPTTPRGAEEAAPSGNASPRASRAEITFCRECVLDSDRGRIEAPGMMSGVKPTSVAVEPGNAVPIGTFARRE